MTVEANKMHRLAVYGSLKIGYGNHGHLKGSQCLGGAWINGFGLVDEGTFPAAFRFAGMEIWAEIYEISDETLYQCDRLEGHRPDSPDNSYYNRIIVNAPIYGQVFMYSQEKRNLVTDVDYWFPRGAWDGNRSHRVKWAGWETEIRLRDDAARRNSALGFNSNKNPPACAYDPPPRQQSGRMEKVWDADTNSFEYVPICAEREDELAIARAKKALALVENDYDDTVTGVIGTAIIPYKQKPFVPQEPRKPTWREVANTKIREGMLKNPKIPEEVYL